jgi:integrase
MRRSEITGTDWTIGAHRYKTAIDFLVPMSGAAVAVLDNVPRVGKSDFVFTIDGRHPIGDMGRRKAQFDELMLIELRKLTGDDDVTILSRWTIHDLRRTARTMMSQAKVPAEHAEAALGHVKKGVEGTYDRYAYLDEKRAAFGKLAELVESIVTPIEAKVAA